jgi:hypothetical protein
MHLAAVAQGGMIFVSRDGGANWLPRDNNRAWRSIACSSDGSRMVAAENGGRLHVSTIHPAQALHYQAPAGEVGMPLTSFTFQVEDNGTATGDPDPSPNTFLLSVSPESAFERWAAAEGLPTDPDAMGGDPLLRFAFGLPPPPENLGVLTISPDGSIQRGQPALLPPGISGGTGFSILAARRKQAGLTFIPEFSHDLSVWEFTPAQPAVIAVDSLVEVLRISFPTQLNQGTVPRFFRIRITTP